MSLYTLKMNKAKYMWISCMKTWKMSENPNSSTKKSQRPTGAYCVVEIVRFEIMFFLKKIFIFS